ncbi:unnamed protein product [Psylliodes chrysocephalus]|uniref:C2H2-type domain-containing protein n=1 Tax=Psylliodes chrysocephalus TaxID=3402493 RepID=A0A9P0D094_9CUCU|nr:unnamed protein product [Psylliodes chrysocephala]
MACTKCNKLETIFQLHYAVGSKRITFNSFLKIVISILEELFHTEGNFEGGFKSILKKNHFIYYRPNFERINKRLSHINDLHALSKINFFHLFWYYKKEFTEENIRGTEESFLGTEIKKLFLNCAAFFESHPKQDNINELFESMENPFKCWDDMSLYAYYAMVDLDISSYFRRSLTEKYVKILYPDDDDASIDDSRRSSFNATAEGTSSLDVSMLNCPAHSSTANEEKSTHVLEATPSESLSVLPLSKENINLEDSDSDDFLGFPPNNSASNRSSTNSEAQYKCKICFQIFPLYINLYNHSRTHTRRGDLDCCFCSKKFDMKIAILNHMKIHKRKS